MDVFTALSNPVRREILAQLRHGPRHVSDLAERFEVGRPAVSEHLQVLRKVGLVREEPRGRERYYYLDPRPLGDLQQWLADFADVWNARLDALDDLIQRIQPPNERPRP